MPVLQEFFIQLATIEGYGIEETNDVYNLSKGMIVKTLHQTGNVRMKVNLQEKKLEEMCIAIQQA